MAKGFRLLAGFPLFSLRNWGVLLLFVYCLAMGYRLFYGENRLSELSRLELRQSRLESALAGLRFERGALEESIGRLQEENLDREFLETLLRSKLKMAREDEAVLILPEAQP